MFRRPLLFVAALTLGATAANAHVTLLASTPDANATTAATQDIVLTFKSKLAPGTAKVDLTMTAMPNMASHAPMKVGNVTLALDAEGKVVTAHAKRPLPKGTYRVDWRAVSADTHVGEGNFSFTVQ